VGRSVHSVTKQDQTKLKYKTEQSVLRATHLIPGELA